LPCTRTHSHTHTIAAFGIGLGDGCGGKEKSASAAAASTPNAIGKPHQRSLKKGHVEQRCSCGERQANADLRQQQERCNGPELIQNQNEWEQSAERCAQLSASWGKTLAFGLELNMSSALPTLKLTVLLGEPDAPVVVGERFSVEDGQ
jgi:hypothetical protein